MKTLKEMIAEGETTKAADVLYEGLIFLFNNFVPNVQLTKDEFAQVMPELITKMQSPEASSSATEPTDAPGDDIVISPTKADLVVKFVAAEGVDTSIPSTYTRTYKIGKKYTYTVPTVPGCVASKTTITGTMTAEGVTETVTYSEAGSSATEPTEADLVVKFVAAEGVNASIPSTYTHTYEIGENYTYTVPTVPGCVASKTTITGTMTAEGVTETVTYSAE